MFSRARVPVSAEDQQLLGMARDLCRQLGYYKMNPDAIIWRGKMGIRTLPPEYFAILRNEIQLSSKMMGRLSPEDWRPIFASGLTYYRNLTRNSLMGMLTTMIPVALLMPVVLVFSFRYLTGSILVYPIILGLIAITIGIGIRFLMVPKKSWFKADVEASRLVGKQQLIDSLRKIEQFDTGKKKGGLVMPSISQRIEKLDSTP